MRFLTFILVALAMLAGACTAPPAVAPPASPSPTMTVPPSPVAASGFPLTVTGDDGRTLALERPPQRIVSLSPGHTETLFALGAGDLLVGVDDFSDYPPAAQRLPRVGYSNVDLERTVALSPDLVLVVTRQQRIIPELERLGLPNLFLSEAQNLDGILDRVHRLGEMTGRQAEAEALVAQMRQRIDAVTARLEGVAGPTVFYELSPQLHTIAPETFIGDMLARLKAKNVAAGAASPFPQLSQEQIVAGNPEVVLLGDVEAGESPATVAARPGWQDVRAVRTGRILPIPNRDIVHRPGPRVVEGLEMLARALYPERFPPP
ncbi:MAG: ABC transporter substrate-binding protein [Chloroflexi bacterium]|nr:ABC transporter substrate-binding protein [Chloroflexota bacterium]